MPAPFFFFNVQCSVFIHRKMSKANLIVSACAGVIGTIALFFTIYSFIKIQKMHTLDVFHAELTSSNAKTLQKISVKIRDNGLDVPIMDTGVAEKLVQDAKKGIRCYGAECIVRSACNASTLSRRV